MIFLFTVLVLSCTALGCATGGADDASDIESDASAPGTLDLWRSSDGQWWFHVVSGNGRILLTSEGYTTRTGALNGVLSVLENGVDADRYEVHATAIGHNVHLHAENARVIGSTESYASKANAKRAVGACVRAVTSYVDTRISATGPRVELVENASGKFTFAIVDDSGATQLRSDAYATPEAAWNGAFASQDAAARDDAFAIAAAPDGSYFFTITADNGRLLALSAPYATHAAAEDGVAAVRALLASIELI